MKHSVKIVLCVFTFLMLSVHNNVYAVARTWVGAGAGGGSTNFNLATNWSPSGVPGVLDDLTMNFTSSATIDLSANCTVNSINVSVSGAITDQLRVQTFVLTVNGSAIFNGVNNNSQMQLNCMAAGAGFVFNGVTVLHNGGNGTLFITANLTSEGSMTFNNDVTLGSGCFTNANVEPRFIFDAVGAQNFIFNCANHFKPAGIIIGVANSPNVTFSGTGSAGNLFTIYNGVFTLNNNSVANLGNFDLDPWVSGTTISLNSTATLRMADNNNFPGFGLGAGPPTNYGTYNISSTSTVDYYGTLAQSVSNLAAPGYGHLILSGSAAKTSAGNFSIRGDFTNNNSFTHNNNTHTFTGTVPQAIGGSVPTTFFNLVINNTGAGVTQNQPVTVSNIWTLTNGAFFLNSLTLTLLNTAVGAVVRTNGFAVSETNTAVNNSKIQWNMTAASIGNHIFPFGVVVGNTYLPFTFDKTSVANAVNITVSTRATTGSDNTPWAGASNVAAVTHMFSPVLLQDGSDEAVIDRWWDISASAAVTGNLTFSYIGSENTLVAPYNTGMLGSQHWNGTAWEAPVGSSAAVTSGVGAVTANGISNFSPFVLSSVSAPLPIELTSLKAECNNNTVLLSWTTATEKNNSFFTVERSEDGISFVEVVRINGAGDSYNTRKYSCADEKAKTGRIIYYRLRQTDKGGISKTSDIISTICSGAENEVRINNTQEGKLSLSVLATNDDEIVLNIYDAFGKALRSQRIYTAKGFTMIMPDISGLPEAYYIIEVLSSSAPKHQKVYISNL